MNKKQNPLPFPYYLWTILFLAIVGMADSIYLSISHYRAYTDIGYQSFCALSKTINCDTVSQSTFSIFMGLPVPVWGIVGYVFFLLLASMAASQAANRQRLWPLLILVSLIFSIYAIVLAFISTFVIHSYCIMCIAIYAINFLLLFCTWLTRNRFTNERFFAGLKQDVVFLWMQRKMTLLRMVPFLVGFAALVTIMPAYWRLEAPKMSEDIPMGITQHGHPWIGAETPELIITEFADYQCFQCKKMHFFLRQLIDEHPDKIRLIHRHFPMDHNFNPIVKEPFHIGSGKMAILAIYAASKGKFWQMNDLLFEINTESKTINIKELAEAVGLNPVELGHSLNDKMLRSKLQRDIISGLKLKISGTPAYVIKEKVYLGQIPPEIIKSALNR